MTSLIVLKAPDDTVFYSLYPSDLPSATSPQEDAVALRSLLLRLHSFINPCFPTTSGSMSPLFSTRPRPPLPAAFAAPPIPHLHGKTRFGDNLEDEWFVVFLLFEISRAFPPFPSAYGIPTHLFPSTPSLSAALEAVRNPETDTRASDSIQSVLKKKVCDYPDKVRTNMHRVVVRVPLPVAQVLKHEPCLISLAVEGFYNRDLDSMKHASRMDKFLRLNGTGGALEIVRISVQMTRIMYAQLVQQRFQAPRCYPMPGREEGSVVYKEAELGMKIACGFEMMYQERKTAGNEGKGSTWEAFRRA
ncbi:hypothetical protein HPP92_014848 [Vanilla planifolia]|uniref:Uncharacterized protein n=1 Tax=Vanilla planifolia TaxID=51239 RepID=A0A835UV58_VANPL|nr:hypothetical protein HPP92_014848 [Vanilla planifolia]